MVNGAFSRETSGASPAKPHAWLPVEANGTKKRQNICVIFSPFIQSRKAGKTATIIVIFTANKNNIFRHPGICETLPRFVASCRALIRTRLILDYQTCNLRQL